MKASDASSRRNLLIGTGEGILAMPWNFLSLPGNFIMAALLNGMTLRAVAPEAKFIARGVVLALAVWMDVRLGGGHARA